MGPVDRVKEDVKPFFQYANDENPSIGIRTWKGVDNQIRTHKVYMNCVSCNIERFKEEQLKEIRFGTGTYFCDKCYNKSTKVIRKYETGRPTPELKRFSELWSSHLFNPSKL